MIITTKTTIIIIRIIILNGIKCTYTNDAVSLLLRPWTTSCACVCMCVCACVYVGERERAGVGVGVTEEKSLTCTLYHVFTNDH